MKADPKSSGKWTLEVVAPGANLGFLLVRRWERVEPNAIQLSALEPDYKVGAEGSSRSSRIGFLVYGVHLHRDYHLAALLNRVAAEGPPFRGLREESFCQGWRRQHQLGRGGMP